AELRIEQALVPARDLGEDRQPVPLGEQCDEVVDGGGETEGGNDVLGRAEPYAGVDDWAQEELLHARILERCDRAPNLLTQCLEPVLLASQIEDGQRVPPCQTPDHALNPARLTNSCTKRSWSSGRTV